MRCSNSSIFTYNAAGAVTSMQLGNGRWESTQFNSRLQPTQIALGATTGATDLLKLDYSYGTTNNNGNVLSQTITVPTVGINTGFTAVQNYSYDSLNRLTQATETISGNQSWKQTFGYDRFGNRNSLAEYEGNTLVNDQTPAIDAANNRFTTASGFTYDLSGNVVTDNLGRTFNYDGENKQKLVKDSQNNFVGEYFYNGDGLRIKKITASETTIFVYDASNKLVAEYSTQLEQTPQVSYLTTDNLGSTRIITNQNGEVINRRDFKPFGEEIARSQYGQDNIDDKFATYKRDEETGLDFAQARMFGNSFGRFTNPDVVIVNLERIQSPHLLNLYVYSKNNPLRFIDPNGLWEWSAALGGRRSDSSIQEEIDFLNSGECLTNEMVAQVNELQNILTQRSEIRTGFALAQQIIDALKPNFSSEAATLQAVKDQYGSENDGNNVVIGIRDPNDKSGVAFTKIEGGKRIVAISSSEISNNNSLFATLMHEGTHLQQAGSYLASGNNPALWQAEYQAYAVASAVAIAGQMAARVPAASSSYSVSGTKIGQGNWTSQQSETAIKNHLFNLGLMQVNSQGQHSATPRGLNGAFPGGGKWK